jgi:UDP-2,3-diacylglucosamine pyrophosphatase LpxH
MQRIEDVRPLVASFQWIFYEASRMSGHLDDEQSTALRGALRDTVRGLAQHFRQLEFYRAWHDRHDRRFRRDHADNLSLVLAALSVLDVNWVGSTLSSVRALVERFGEHDPCRAGARKEALSSVGHASLRHVVYGHTHEPLQVALRADRSHDLYLNSGTWRRREFQADEGGGFVGWEMCSYLVFYDEEETARGWGGVGPAYELWAGSRS